MVIKRAKFAVGHLVHHSLFDYRAVIIDVDPCFLGTVEWYESVATSRPPKDAPWYHCLVHNGVHRTYVAERNLTHDLSAEPIDNPDVELYFSDFEAGCYILEPNTN